jgi:hypothetical protein
VRVDPQLKNEEIPTLEVGIPLLSGLSLARSAVDDVLNWPDVSIIHISVNDAGHDAQAYKDLESLDNRIIVTCQETNLGLYGNFRYLVEHSKSTFFIWHAFDDHISRNTLAQALKYINSNREIALAVIPFNSQECYSNPIRYEGPPTLGMVPNMQSRQSRFNSALYAEPSWIFGIWRSDYLREVFPSSNFDWLDSYLLIKAVASNKTGLTRVSEPMIIGTWNWRGKIPHSVNGRSHSSKKYLLYSTWALLTNGYLFHYKELYEYLRLCIYRVKQAKRLTIQLRKQSD